MPMRKIKLTTQNLNNWMCDHWNLYASQTYDEILLRLWTNGDGGFRVVHGDVILYEGNQITQAIATWNAA